MTPPALRSRHVAHDLLVSVLHARLTLSDALAAHGDLARLEARDRAFARNLVTTTLRRLGQIDAVLGGFLEKPLPRKAETAVMAVLRLGAAQLLFLKTPPHAAIDTSVRLVQAVQPGRFDKLVNAILRRTEREGAGLIARQDAARLATPDWLWESWEAAYGADTCRAIAESHLSEPPLDLTLKDPAQAETWAARLDAARLPTGSLRRDHRGSVPDLPGFDEGAWWVQDAAAALPARLLGDVAGRTVIDLCAAPGGKTAQLAAMGARVTAVERSKNRMTRLAENLARLGLEAETVVADAQQWRPDAPADAVLLDAPCSATGTIRRHPEVAWLKRPADVAKLAVAQDRLLAAAINMVRPGGVLVYCTCSLQPEEGPARVADLLASGAPVVPEPVTAAEVGGLAEILDESGRLRTLPSHLADHGGLDGFFAARLRRS